MAAAKQRVSCWQHPDGDDATINRIEGCMTGEGLRLIADSNIGIYPGTDMKIGVDLRMLARGASLLASLLELDPRGKGGGLLYAEAHAATCGN